MSGTRSTAALTQARLRAKPGPKPGSSRSLPPHDTITEGATIGVLLSNRPDRVWLDRADYARLITAYGTRAWVWVNTARYVRVRPSASEDVPVARAVLESDGGGFVHYADGDRLNLRRENLSIQPQRERGRILKRPVKGTFGKQIAVLGKPHSAKGDAWQFHTSQSLSNPCWRHQP